MLDFPYILEYKEFLINYQQTAILLEPLNTNFKVPFKLLDGVTLCLAEDKEKEWLRELYKENNLFHGPYSIGTMFKELYAGELYASDIYNKGKTKGEVIPAIVVPAPLKQTPNANKEFERISVPIIESEWDYWFVKIDENCLSNRESYLLMDALLFSNAHLSTGIIYQDGGGYQGYIDPNRFYKDYPIILFYKDNRAHIKEYKKTLSQKQAEHIANFFTLLRHFDFENYPFVGKAIIEYKNILQIPRDSSLTIIGLFSILELLLTHDDRRTEATRIGWQLCKKIPLLNHRFENSINFSEYFQCDADVKEETIIERLYLKRSITAHGNQKLEKLEPKLEIISRGDEIAFLKLLIRRIVTLALEEPRLIADLKEC